MLANLRLTCKTRERFQDVNRALSAKLAYPAVKDVATEHDLDVLDRRVGPEPQVLYDPPFEFFALTASVIAATISFSAVIGRSSTPPSTTPSSALMSSETGASPRETRSITAHFPNVSRSM